MQSRRADWLPLCKCPTGLENYVSAVSQYAAVALIVAVVLRKGSQIGKTERDSPAIEDGRRAGEE